MIDGVEVGPAGEVELRGSAPFILLTEPGAVVDESARNTLLTAATRAPATVAAFEPRQVPIEDTKPYDPVTLATAWCSAPALLVRRAAITQQAGRIGSLLDLSLRLRTARFELRYVPGAVVANTRSDALRQSARLSQSLRLGGRIFGTSRVDARLPRAWPRQGAFPLTRAAGPGAAPLVSVLMRSLGRPSFLQQSVATVRHQTWPNVELVVVEDGPPRSESLIRSLLEGADVSLSYEATGAPRGRTRAGNLALGRARGEYLLFLDEDDLLFADHVETLMDAVTHSRGVLLAHSLARELPSELREDAVVTDEETLAEIAFRPPFSRARLWLLGNFLPIQSVLFHRQLYERAGGFDERLELLEDWELWLRYCLLTPFAYVPKETSAYRVPRSLQATLVRLTALRDHHHLVEEKKAVLFNALPDDRRAELEAELARAERAGLGASRPWGWPQQALRVITDSPSAAAAVRRLYRRWAVRRPSRGG